MKSFRQYLRQTLYESDPQKYDDVGKKIDNETSKVKETPNEALYVKPPRVPDPTTRYLAPRTSAVDEPRQGQYGADIDISGDDTDIIVPTDYTMDRIEDGYAVWGAAEKDRIRIDRKIKDRIHRELLQWRADQAEVERISAKRSAPTPAPTGYSTTPAPAPPTPAVKVP